MPEFEIEDLVGEAVEGLNQNILRDVEGEMRITAIDGAPKEVSVDVSGGNQAVFYMEEDDRIDFGGRAIGVTVDFAGFETFQEEFPRKGLGEMGRLPYKFKMKRFTAKQKKQALVDIWPIKVKALIARLTP